MRTGQFVVSDVPAELMEEAARFVASDGRARLVITDGTSYRIAAGSALAEGEAVAGVVAAYAEDDAAPMVDLQDGEAGQ